MVCLILYDPDDFEDGEFPEPAGDKWEEALDQYIEDAWYRFENNFSKIAKIENGMLALYREITVESIPRFLYFLQKGKTIPSFKGIGIFWSWDKDKAEAHHGYVGHAVLIKGLVKLSDINYASTALKNLNPALGVPEAEIQIKKGSLVYITEVYSDNHGKTIWEGTVEVKASINKNILSALRQVVQ